MIMLLNEEKKYILPGELFLCFLSHTCPEAHKYFVEYISKAYQALTDPTSRKNYKKYGHPDGQQVILASLDPNVSMKAKFCNVIFPEQGRLGAVVRAVSLSHQVVGSKQPLRKFCGGKTCLSLSLPQTPLM